MLSCCLRSTLDLPHASAAGVLDLNLRVSFCREICLLHGLCDVDRWAH